VEKKSSLNSHSAVVADKLIKGWGEESVSSAKMQSKTAARAGGTCLAIYLNAMIEKL
jgi:hypothetical protein